MSLPCGVVCHVGKRCEGTSLQNGLVMLPPHSKVEQMGAHRCGDGPYLSTVCGLRQALDTYWWWSGSLRGQLVWEEAVGVGKAQPAQQGSVGQEHGGSRVLA